MQLEKLQQQFLTSLYEENDYAALLRTVVTDKQFPADERLSLYRNISLNAHIKALSETYPICEKILGENYFKQMANLYVREHRSLNPDLNQYGEIFSAWLNTFSETHDELNEYPYLPDLAQLEWYWQSAYYTEDANEFNFTSFSKINEAVQTQLVFKTHPTLFLLDSVYPIYEIWEKNRRERRADIKIQALTETQYLRIYRPGSDVIVQMMTEHEYRLLKAIKQQKTLNELHQAAEKNSWDIDRLLPDFIQQKLICDFYIA